MIPLHSKMHNGASVSDWLGTAKTAAEIAVDLVELVRSGDATDPDTLNRVEAYLDDALEEVRQVRVHIAHVAAYSSDDQT